MKRYRFEPEMSFAEARRQIQEINDPHHRELLAKLTWKEGTAKDQSIPYLYDSLAERFGHTIDKSSIHTEVLTSLYNGIPIEVELVTRPSHPEKER